MSKFLAHMPVVAAYGQRLASLQTVWDSLALLSQMSADGNDMGRTRKAFESLSAELVNQLAAETHRKTLQELGAKAQVTVDVLVRNLFERTADIGFLCLDAPIADFLEKRENEREIARRLREYASKYSVYQDIVLIDTEGNVVARLDESLSVARTDDPLIAEALQTSKPYLERCAPSDLFPGEGGVLLYAWRVVRDGRKLGVLVLRFRFEDEMRAIFGQLTDAADWSVLTLVDAKGIVIASSDPWQIPRGAPLTLAKDDDGGVVRFAGREYLAVTRPCKPYQGYAGPGWLGHALAPLEHAYDALPTRDVSGVDAALLVEMERSADVFAPELRAIPQRAQDIQRELTQAVWNGNVKLSAQQGQDNAYSRSLLREISATGLRTKEVFERSISDLHQTVVSALLHACRFRASLASEILDRNLYERANDVRWWALNGALAAAVAKGDGDAATPILERINALYTVYDNLILFDRECRVVAVSNPKRRALRGQRLEGAWARETLTMRDSQAYAVSAFEPLAHYDDRPSYVFGSALQGLEGRNVGGIAVVFDAATQLPTMLREVLPDAHPENHFALFVEPSGTVIAASAHFESGQRITLPPALLDPPPEGSIGFMIHDGRHYAVGSRRSTGYREFRGLGTIALTMSAVGPVREAAVGVIAPFVYSRRSVPRTEALDLATVACGTQWLALTANSIVAAIQDARPTRIPGRAPWLSGVIRHADSLVPVIDLAKLLGQRSSETPTIIVAKENGQLVGLAVDQLGDVLEVALSEIAIVDATSAGQNAGLTPGILRARGANDSTALMLDLAAVLRVAR